MMMMMKNLMRNTHIKFMILLVGLFSSCGDPLDSFEDQCEFGGNCVEPTNDCVDEPCINGGVCIDGVGGFKCDCAEGFSGVTCAENINDCANEPCENGDCIDGIASFTCDCAEGFSGDLCQLDINECERENGGCAQICINVSGNFRCECDSGYERSDNLFDCEPCAEGLVSLGGELRCEPCEGGTYDDGSEICQSCPAEFTSVESSTGCFVSAVSGYTHPRDYGFIFWPENHRNQQSVFLNIEHIQTGFYGLIVDVSTMSLINMGMIDQVLSLEDASHSPNSLITSLPNSSVSYTVTKGNVDHATDVFYGEGRATSNPSRLTDMGRFMQRIDVPEITYNGTSDLEGNIWLAAMPRHLVMTHKVSSQVAENDLTIKIDLSQLLLDQYPNEQFRLDGRAISLTDQAGDGWTFIIPEYVGATSQIIRRRDGSLSFERTFSGTPAGQEISISVIMVPSNAADENQLKVWLTPNEAVSVKYAQLNRDGSGGSSLNAASWDPERGLYVVNLAGLGGANWYDLSIHNRYNRHRLVIDNYLEDPVSIPIAFDGGGSSAYYITGGSPLLRDMNGEPVGAPVQISKNWHDPPAWYHLYSSLFMSTGRHELEHTFAHSKWGEAYAVAHAQLSLIGWGQNQQWDESSIGAFGESITYDPDLTLNRAMVDDVRPFLVQASNKWSWTGNVGGASFLVYDNGTGVARPDHELGRLKSNYLYTGPNLTDVVYTGITRDGKISARISTQLTRTDDLVRAYYHLNYIVNEDVTYERLALFQIASDRYADNGFKKYAYGNASAVLFDEDIPRHATTGYASPESRGIAIEGVAPWVMLYDSEHDGGNLPEYYANIAFVVRDYQAQIGETLITTPHININRTYNGGWSQMAFELGVPYDPQNMMIPAGSEISATVEYLIPPADKAVYYGESDYLSAMSEFSFQTTDMILKLAADNQLAVTPFVGNLIRSNPVEFNAAPGATATRFLLTGGLGYTPITIHGLARYDGWRLEKLENDTWVRVDQSVEGNDYWQAFDRASEQSFDLIFNVHNRGTHQYRLVRGDSPCIGVLTEDAQVCDDVDECLSNNGGCEQVCENLEGYFQCGCDSGYILNDNQLSCDDIDECLVNNGGCDQDCNNQLGTFLCSCAVGYTLNEDGFTCDDIDECLHTSLNDCTAEEPCSNTDGAYVCGCAPPLCQPEGCTDPNAPNYVPEALLDDGSCFICDEETSLSFRYMECDWDCDQTWGVCWSKSQGEYCEFYFCETVNSCDLETEPSVDLFQSEREMVEALGSLIAPPILRLDEMTEITVEVAAGETRALYYDALDYQGSSTRVFAYIGIPSSASEENPVPGIVLVHGGGGTAYRSWVDQWTSRGYAAISIAVEGQNDDPATQVEIDNDESVGSWHKHQAHGPVRVGVYGDTALPVDEQWMYHAVADTILANSLLRSLPEVNASEVGLMGISWGGVITATVMGLDDRFAFTMPIYGHGHKFDIPNYFGNALENNDMYRQLWDPILWIEGAEMPSLWLTWLQENNFSHDGQAATYHKTLGQRMVSIVPNMGHGHAIAWHRPESYDFADSVINTQSPWCQQLELNQEEGLVEVSFESSKPLLAAKLLYTLDFGWTGDMIWTETEVSSLSEESPGIWQVTAVLPQEATAWFVNVYAQGSDTANQYNYSSADLVVSSDYQEVIEVNLAPESGLLMGHPLAADRSSASAMLSFTAPSYVEIVDIAVHSESHPGAFCSLVELPRSLKSPAPMIHPIEVSFDNRVAVLQEGQQATAVLNVVWRALDGTMGQVDLPVEVVARSAFDIIYRENAEWSSERVYAADRVTITDGAEVTLDQDQTVSRLTLIEGVLDMTQSDTLNVNDQLTINHLGVINLTDGVLNTDDANVDLDGLIRIDGGSFTANMEGRARTISGDGLIEISQGDMSFLNGVPSNVLQINTDMRITGGTVSLSGQIYVGFTRITQFEIIGNEATVSMVRLNMGGQINKGTLIFRLDEDGVSKINVPGWMNLGSAKLIVDGSAYTGGPTSIVLVGSTNLVSPISASNITVTGFSSQGLIARVEQDAANGKDWVRLIIE